jgi:hypothetical protein
MVPWIMMRANITKNNKKDCQGSCTAHSLCCKPFHTRCLFQCVDSLASPASSLTSLFWKWRQQPTASERKLQIIPKNLYRKLGSQQEALPLITTSDPRHFDTHVYTMCEQVKALVATNGRGRKPKLQEAPWLLFQWYHIRLLWQCNNPRIHAKDKLNLM